jgi:prepilin-type N-terminal cleavage/methylation domain-containing protein
MRRGFTLVELSMVLVIVGLLVGAIMGGQSLIRASNLRAVGTELQQYKTALHTFSDQYLALPGDMGNAVKYWGAADGNDGTGSDCYGAVGTGTQTCNGNANGYINSDTTNFGNEVFRAWQHMSNAGVIEGAFTGVAATTGLSRVVNLGVNIPRSRHSSGGYYLEWAGTQSASWAFPGRYGHAFWFGAPETSPPDILENGWLTPRDMWSIDQKIDDGKPALGEFRSYRLSDCAVDVNNVATDYRLTITQPLCFGIFITGL